MLFQRFNFIAQNSIAPLVLFPFLACNQPDQHHKTSSSTSAKKEIFSDAATSVYDRALAWAEKGDERVLPLCDSLLKLNDAQIGVSPFYYLGIYHAERGDTVNALGYFDQAIVTDYTFLEAYIEKAALLLALKKPAEAQKELALLRAIAPTFAPCHYWIAKVAEYERKTDMAIHHYKLALSLDSALVEARQGVLRLEK